MGPQIRGTEQGVLPRSQIYMGAPIGIVDYHRELSESTAALGLVFCEALLAFPELKYHQGPTQ